jgi:hypothetical protein
MTLAQAIVMWKTQNPIESLFPVVTTEEYELMAADRGQMLLDAYNLQQAEAARIALRKKYRAAKTELAIAVTAQNAVTRLTNTRTIIDGLLEILKDSGLVLDD